MQEISVLPGRVRLKDKALYYNKQLSIYVNDYCSSLYGVKHSEVSYVTASVLIVYDNEKMNLKMLKEKIKAAINSVSEDDLKKIEHKDLYSVAVEKRDRAKKKILIYAILYLLFKVKSFYYGRFSLSRNVRILEVAAIVTVILGYPIIKQFYNSFTRNIPSDTDLLLRVTAVSLTFLRESPEGILLLVLNALNDYIKYSSKVNHIRVVKENLETKNTYTLEGQEILLDYRSEISEDFLTEYNRVEKYERNITRVSIGAAALNYLITRNRLSVISMMLALNPHALRIALDSGINNYNYMANKNKTYIQNYEEGTINQCDLKYLKNSSSRFINQSITISVIYSLVFGTLTFSNYFNPFTAKTLETLNCIMVHLLNERILFLPENNI